MESKIIEFGIILLHKYREQQTEVILTFLLTNYKNVWSDRTFTFPNTFSYFFQSYDITSLGYTVFIQTHFETMQSTQSKCR